MRALWWGGLVVGVGGIAASVAACESSDDGASAARGNCEEGSHVVGSACVPDVFDEADIPSSKDVPIDTDENGESYLRGMVLIGLRDPAGGRAAAEHAAAINGGVVTGGIPFAGLWQIRYDSALTAVDLGTDIITLGFDSNVEFATRDVVSNDVLNAPEPSDTEKVSPDATWTDPHSPLLGLVGPKGKWAYESTGVYDAWKAIDAANPATKPVAIAVLDDIVTPSPVFAALPLNGGYDVRVFGAFSEHEPAVHGNQVASIIGAPNDGTGMNGVAAGLPKCVQHDLAPIAVVADYLLPGQTLGDAGPDAGLGASFAATKHAGQSALLMGMVFAVRSGARVVNMSLGSNYGPEPTAQNHLANFGKIQRAIFAKSRDVLWVAAGRNDGGDDTQTLPAAAGFGASPNVITVDPLRVADGASRGRWPWRAADGTLRDPDTQPGSAPIAAPGEDVLAQLPNGDLTMFLGASAATPVVSGVAGLIFAVHPDLKGSDVRDILLSTAGPSGDPSIQGKRLDAKKAVETALDRLKTAYPDRLGKGTCSGEVTDAGPAAPAKTCGPDTICEFCVTSTYSIKIPSSTPPTDVSTQGTGSVYFSWADDDRVGYLTLDVDDATGKHGVIIDSSHMDISGTSKRYSSVDVKSAEPSNYGLADQADGAERVMGGFELSATFSGDNVTGTFALHENIDGGGGAATGSFHGSIRPAPASCP